MARVQVQSPAPIGHDTDGQDANRQLMPGAKPVGDRLSHVAAAHPQFVGRGLCRDIQVGEVVAPMFDRAAHFMRDALIGVICAAHCPSPRIECAGERLRPARGARQPFLKLGSVDVEIGEYRIGQPPSHRRCAAARSAHRQCAGVEIEPLGRSHQQGGRHRTLATLDKVEIAG
ncbi:hypothetical protein [Sphingomonas sp.]|uniref:hypothetical protein n=1 Tax=Sphingomonas sp. TaxID=28214 RepID=UPI002D1BEF63|nr:hypothetical protein [Sphingomonas sp.]HTG37471.1 hypothetical protein [Sphingomonas sp.]